MYKDLIQAPYLKSGANASLKKRLVNTSLERPVSAIRARRKKHATKRRVLICVFVFSIVCAFFISPHAFTSFGATTETEDVTTQISEHVKDALDKVDFGDLDEISSGLDSGFSLFKGSSFSSKVGKILSGEFTEDYPNMLSAIIGLCGGLITDVLPFVIIIVAIGILSSFVQSLESGNGGVQDIIHFVTYGAVIVVVLGASADLSMSVGSVLASIKNQMDIIFPILLSFMAALGGVASVGVYQPAVVLLSAGVMQIFTHVVMPIFFITLVFSVVGNLSNTVKLDKFVAFFTSLFKWIVGIVFTLFLAFLTIQGITAATHDGMSIRAAKLTISAYVPFLGSYVSQGFDLVLASSVLIKNAVGVAGLYLLLSVVLGPVLKIVVFALGLKLAAAIIGALPDARISNFLTSIAKAFNMLLACVIGASFMYFITIGLVIMTGNMI